MQAAFTPSYGPASLIELRALPTPTIAENQVLVRVQASPVTQGDRRLRSADFPGVSALPGRMMLGVFGPRHGVQGTMFAGRIVEVGSDVTQYAVGDDVFGSAEHGAYAEYLSVDEGGPMAKMPERMGYDEAAAVPYGAGTALHFLRELAAVQPGESVLVLGASGGVGRFAVQLAKHLGAEVTGVCSRSNFERVRELGADHLIDYKSADFTHNGQRYDVVFDIAGASSFAQSRSSLTERGRYMTVYLSVGVLFQMARTALLGGPKAVFSVSFGDQAQMVELAELMAQGVLDPVIARRFPLERIAEAHTAVEGGVEGAVVVTMAPAEKLRTVG